MDDEFPNAKKILDCLLENLEEGIQVIDCEGKTIYYNKTMGKVEGVDPRDVIGKKVNEYLVDVKDDESTLMNVLRSGKKIVDLIQHYGNGYKKKVTTINTTLPVTIDNKVIAVIEIAKDMTQLKELSENILKLQKMDKRLNGHYTFSDIYSNNPVMKSIIEKAGKASMSSSTVLLYAETGSGKEVFSQSIHYCGLRKDKPFIPINCAAIPALLLEGMLFGTEKGGFTGAENKKGLFEEANHGTILLDEVNSLEPYVSAMISPTQNSATARALRPGAIMIGMARSVAAATLMLTASVRVQPMTRSRGNRPSTARVSGGMWLRMISASAASATTSSSAPTNSRISALCWAGSSG